MHEVDISPVGVLEDIAEGSTAELILQAAGRLFAAKGFHGISTREIAQAVGIRQPSLFHHFSSKTQIAQYLLEYGRLRSPLLRGVELLPQARPAVRLYATFRYEIELEVSSRFEMRGLYLTGLLEEPEFAFWKSKYDAARARGYELIKQGMNRGDFSQGPIDIVVNFFDAILLSAVRWRQQDPLAVDADAVTSLLLKSVLNQTQELSDIRSEALRLLSS
ncbi:TetR/AcrR family transcriptional regulator [Agrobacterium sp. P15N1-A]|uniref:TetR/AcrR family transcriptional regulator n=1 Tax=Agrobacterium sp. P15N1-A TaxID=3342820 RepID=UPI0037CCD186